jgi:hypothetical protein
MILCLFEKKHGLYEKMKCLGALFLLLNGYKGSFL